MAYRLVDGGWRASGLGCGAECRCRACRTVSNGYGETYIREEEPDEQEIGSVNRTGGGSTGRVSYGGFTGVPASEARAREQRMYRIQERDCRGVRVLQTLSRTSMTPEERVRFLERKLAAVPRLVDGQRAMQQILHARARGAPEAAVREALTRILEAYPELVQFPFPRGYAVGSVERERAITRCELSRARWELAVSQRGGRIRGRLHRTRLPGP